MKKNSQTHYMWYKTIMNFFVLKNVVGSTMSYIFMFDLLCLFIPKTAYTYFVTMICYLSNLHFCAICVWYLILFKWFLFQCLLILMSLKFTLNVVCNLSLFKFFLMDGPKKLRHHMVYDRIEIGCYKLNSRWGVLSK